MPLLYNENIFSFGSPLNALLAEGDFVGSTSLPLTNVSTGSRDSAMVGGSGRGVNEVDSLTLSGVPFVSSMSAATNLVSTDITAVDWKKEGLVSVAEPSTGLFTATISGSNSIRQQFTTVNLQEYTFSFMAKRGTSTAINTRVYDNTATADVSFTINGGSSVSGASSYYNLINGTTYERIDIKFTGNGNNFYVYLNNGGDNGTVFFKGVRAVGLSAPSAPFVDGTGAGESVAVDKISFSHTYPAAGYAVIDFQSYGWSDTGNPVDAEPLLLSAGAFTVTLDASGFFATSGGAVSTIKPVDGSNHVIIVEWGGGNHTISVDDETPVVAASAVVPSGTSYDGNISTGSNPAHAIQSVWLNDGAPSSTDRTTLNIGLTAIAQGITLN